MYMPADGTAVLCKVMTERLRAGRGGGGGGGGGGWDGDGKREIMG